MMNENKIVSVTLNTTAPHLPKATGLGGQALLPVSSSQYQVNGLMNAVYVIFLGILASV